MTFFTVLGIIVSIFSGIFLVVCLATEIYDVIQERRRERKARDKYR